MDERVVLMMFATPLVYGVFTAMCGLKLNTVYTNLDWVSEVQIVKQGAPVMITMFVGMAISLVPLILTFFAGPVVSYIATAALAGVCILLYRSIMTKGVQAFDRLIA